MNPESKSQCAVGHKGALCEKCDLEGTVWSEPYANSDEFSCSKCSEVSGNILKIFLISIF